MVYYTCINYLIFEIIFSFFVMTVLFNLFLFNGFLSFLISGVTLCIFIGRKANKKLIICRSESWDIRWLFHWRILNVNVWTVF
jgi:hypothetical protein